MKLPLKFLGIPPIMKPGSIPALSSTHDISVEVVVLPCVPDTTMALLPFMANLLSAWGIEM